MTDDELSELSDPDLTLVTHGLWFVGRKGRPGDVRALAGGESQSVKTGQRTVFVVSFTDADQADRFVSQPGAPPDAIAIHYPTRSVIAPVLEALIAAGRTHLAIDPGERRAVPIPIEHVLEAVRRGSSGLS